MHDDAATALIDAEIYFHVKIEGMILIDLFSDKFVVSFVCLWVIVDWNKFLEMCWGKVITSYRGVMKIKLI